MGLVNSIHSSSLQQLIKMGLEIKNLFQLPHIIKLPVLVMTFITMVLARCGYEGNPLGFGDDSDSAYFGVMVVYGFFFLTMNITVTMCGFIFYLAVGSSLLSTPVIKEITEEQALGAMCILTAFVFLADTSI